jgi:hypothetical protein
MGTQASTEDTDLQSLSDPEFFAHWAAVRSRLALAPTGGSREDARREYEAAAAEYRRRMGGAESPTLTATAGKAAGSVAAIPKISTKARISNNVDRAGAMSAGLVGLSL